MVRSWETNDVEPSQSQTEPTQQPQQVRCTDRYIPLEEESKEQTLIESNHHQASAT